MNFFKNQKVVKGGLAIILLGLLFASVPFFQLIHHHSYSTDHSKVAHLKGYEAKCCDAVKIQNHLQGIIPSADHFFKISFIDDYTIGAYHYAFKTIVALGNKAPPLNLVV